MSGSKKISTALTIVTLCFPAMGYTASGQAVIHSTQEGSKVEGKVLFIETEAGLKVTGEFAGLPPGKHAFHIHEFGDCSAAGKAAGSHYNPTKAPHGLLVRDGIEHAHAGDMGNLSADADGVAKTETILPEVFLTDGVVSVAGRSVIVHEKEDDFGQPAGNAGGRIGCGEIVITG